MDSQIQLEDILEKEKQINEELRKLKESLGNQILDLENKYRIEIENLKMNWNKKIENVSSLCQEELNKLEKEFKERLHKDSENLRKTWVEIEEKAIKELLKKINDKNFYKEFLND